VSVVHNGPRRRGPGCEQTPIMNYFGNAGLCSGPTWCLMDMKPCKS